MIIDVTDWKIDETVTAGGTREKFWVIHPDNHVRYLFKLPREKTGEIWAEKMASEIGKILGLKMMDVEIATYEERMGILLKNFTEFGEEEFFDGGDLLKNVVENFDPETLDDYNLENIMLCLKPYGLEKEMIKVLVFDAFIANQDRHCENWGVIQRNRNIRFAPIFDNGASLGYSNSESRIKKMFRDPRMFKAFTNKAWSIVGLSNKRKPKIKDFLLHLRERYPCLINEEMDRLKYLQKSDIQHILQQIPRHVMTETEKTLGRKDPSISQELDYRLYKGVLNHGKTILTMACLAKYRNEK